jgi:hypothetical protein
MTRTDIGSSEGADLSLGRAAGRNDPHETKVCLKEVLTSSTTSDLGGARSRLWGLSAAMALDTAEPCLHRCEDSGESGGPGRRIGGAGAALVAAPGTWVSA